MDDESVLNALLREGVDVPYGCQSGVCQSCIMKTEHSEVPKAAQKGLREVQKQQGYFLSCCCKPTEPMVVSLLRVKKVICYRPGQYMTLWKGDDVARSYSLASHPTQDDYIEFHIRVYQDGIFSPWVAEQLHVGDSIEIQGPMGDCFYTADDKTKPLFLSGLGTGLAPLYGIARDALLRGHTGKILLLMGARAEAGLYYQKELDILQQRYANVEVRYSVQETVPEFAAINSRESDIYSATKMLMPDFSNVKVYLCGAQSFVSKMRKQCFLSGANMGDIHSDVFLSFPK